jgi:hypothetical protein
VSGRLPQRSFDLDPHVIGTVFFRREQAKLNDAGGFKRYPLGEGEIVIGHAVQTISGMSVFHPLRTLTHQQFRHNFG